MTIYLVVLMCLLSQAGFGGSRVAVSLHALQLSSNQLMIGVMPSMNMSAPMRSPSMRATSIELSP